MSVISGDSSRVEQSLHATDGGSTPTSPLQLHFEQMKAKAGAELNARWHSVLPSIPYFHIQIAFGAFIDGVPYAVALWGRPVARTICGLGWLELRRMAIAPEAPRFTASRMLAWMRRELASLRPDVVRLISYQDTEHHKGTIYRAAGWRPVLMKHSPVNWGGAAQTKTPPSRTRKTKLLKAPKIRWEIDGLIR